MSKLIGFFFVVKMMFQVPKWFDISNFGRFTLLQSCAILVVYAIAVLSIIFMWSIKPLIANIHISKIISKIIHIIMKEWKTKSIRSLKVKLLKLKSLRMRRLWHSLCFGNSFEKCLRLVV